MRSSIILPLLSFCSLFSHIGLWALKSPKIMYGSGNWYIIFFNWFRVKLSLGGKYIEHTVNGLNVDTLDGYTLQFCINFYFFLRDVVFYEQGSASCCYDRVFVDKMVWGVIFYFEVVICKFGFLYTDDVWVF